MIFSFLIATFVMSDILFDLFVGSTKIGEISDISKCFENFVSQTLGVLTRIYAAELRQLLEVLIATATVGSTNVERVAALLYGLDDFL